MPNGNLRSSLDACAAVAATVNWSDYLAKIAAGMAIIWYLIRFFEYLKEKYGKKS